MGEGEPRGYEEQVVVEKPNVSGLDDATVKAVLKAQSGSNAEKLLALLISVDENEQYRIERLKNDIAKADVDSGSYEYLTGQLEDRLHPIESKLKGTPEELVRFAQHKIVKALQSGNLDIAKKIATALSLAQELESINPLTKATKIADRQEAVKAGKVLAAEMRKKLEALQDEQDLQTYAACKTAEEKFAFLETYFGDLSKRSDQKPGPKVLELKKDFETFRIRAEFKDKKRAKSGEAFQSAMNVLRTMPEIFATWTPEMKSRIQDEAAEKIKELLSGYSPKNAKPMMDQCRAAGVFDAGLQKKIHDEMVLKIKTEIRGYNAYGARQLVEQLLEMGILDFDQDEELIDKATSK